MKKEIFQRVKRSRGSFVLTLGSNNAIKWKMRIIQRSSFARMLTSTPTICYDWTCSVCSNSADSVSIHKGEDSTNAQYQEGVYWSWASEHKYKALNVWYIHSWLGNDKQWGSCQVNSHIQTATLEPWAFEGHPECAALAIAFTGKHIWADQSTEDFQAWALGCRLGAFLSLMNYALLFYLH